MKLVTGKAMVVRKVNMALSGAAGFKPTRSAGASKHDASASLTLLMNALPHDFLWICWLFLPVRC